MRSGTLNREKEKKDFLCKALFIKRNQALATSYKVREGEREKGEKKRKRERGNLKYCSEYINVKSIALPMATLQKKTEKMHIS